jgi:hypothetical protein
VLSNPPYAPLGTHAGTASFGQRFLSAGDVMTSSVNIYPLFVEQGARLLGPHGTLAMVTPLSVTFSSSAQMKGLRRALSEITGRLEFLSFDRTPDSLFGDDVKTRNTIVVVRKDESRSVWATGLLRWTSRTRSTFLSSVEPVPVNPNIELFVPKVDCVEDYQLYEAARRWPNRLDDWVVNWCRANPGLGDNGEPNALYAAPTAYNWLNLVLNLRRLTELGHTSVCDYRGAQFESALYRDAAYAIGCSRMAYLLWRVEGDGFHLTQAFIRRLPTPGPSVVAQLAELGRELWIEVNQHPVMSSNARKQSVSLPPLPSSLALAAIDELLAQCLGLPGHVDLRRWHEARVVVDTTDERRKSQFHRRSLDATRRH